MQNNLKIENPNAQGQVLKQPAQPIIFYRKPAKYGHATAAFAVPEQIAKTLDRGKLYKITVEEVN